MAGELRKRILEADDLGTEVVHVPEWDVDVEVGSMSGKMRARFMRSMSGTDTTSERYFEQFFADIVIATACDPETHEPLFTPADRDPLNAKNGAALGKLAEVAMRLAGLSSTAVEDTAADFDATPSDGSTTS